VKSPFVIAVASEKGGVGKTTIATNLAVYLKALREDLPVTIASFDNHFSVDQMFALGPRPDGNIAALLEGAAPEELCRLGQYGVQYIASARKLSPPVHPPSWLGQHLGSATLPGILIFDTRPILDWFTEGALLAADLVLVPVKDRAALVNAAALRQVLHDVGCADRLWLVPSLVDTRARLNATVRVHEFLAYAARERDYQVTDLWISKSPKVESLASGFSSNIPPVITHARNTAVHGQFKSLAEFVLARFDQAPNGNRGLPGAFRLEAQAETVFGPLRRLVLECPVCCRRSVSAEGHFFFDLRSRRRGLIHPACFSRIFDTLELEAPDVPEGLLAMTIDGPGLVGPDCSVTALICGPEGGLADSGAIGLNSRKPLVEALAMMTGRSLESAYRELVLIDCHARSLDDCLSGESLSGFAKRRRLVIRELRNAGLF
jgi:cellulose biosynthesis protein BcsQ